MMTQTPEEPIAAAYHRHRCRFDFADIRRVPVTQTDAVKARLIASSHEGRLLPQALSEYFGKVTEVECVELDLEQVDEYEHLRITIQSHVPAHTWWLRTDRLDVPTLRMDAPGFDVWRVCEAAVAAWRAHVVRQQAQ